MPNCLFCAKPLNHATPPEHILLDCLGGRKKSKRVICGACNRLLGGSIDAALARAVEPFRSAHALPSGSRNRAPDAAPDPTPPPFDAPFALRALTKMGLLLWADRLSQAEMAKDCWLRAKAQVMAGAALVPCETPLLAPTSLLLSDDFGPLAHRLWVSSDQAGRVIVGAGFYGQPGRSLELCAAGAEPGLHLLMLSDPANPAHWRLYVSHQ